MNNILIKLLTQEELDVTSIVKLITFGQPKKFCWFTASGYKPISLFDTVSGETAFHLLARKGKLSDVLPTLFSNAETILAREGILSPKTVGKSLESFAQNFIFNSLMKPNSAGFNALHFAVYYRDYEALDKIIELGFNVHVAAVERKGDEVFGIRHVSPIDFAFKEQDKAVDFVTTSIVNGYSDLFDSIYPFLTKEHYRIIPNVLKAVKDSEGDVTTKLSLFNNFARLFNDGWSDILASDPNGALVIQKMSRLMNLLENHNDEYWGISESQLKILIGQEIGLSVEHTVLIEAVQKHVLDTYARQYLKGGDIDLKLGKIFVKSQDIFDIKVSPTVKKEGVLSRELVEKMEDFVYRGNFVDVDALSEKSVLEVESVVDEKLVYNKSSLNVDAKVVAKDSTLVKMVGSRSADKDVKVAIPVDLVSGGKRVKSVKEYVSAVIKLITSPQNTHCYKMILGNLTDKETINCTELHSVILIATHKEKYFEDKILQKAAKVLNAQPISYTDFVSGYVKTLTKEDLTNHNPYCGLSAFDIACSGNNLTWVKALFEKGFDLGVYHSRSYTMYNRALKVNATDVLEYLFKEQELVEVDWSEILMQSLHYANIAAVRYYVESDAKIIRVATDRKDMDVKGKYTVLNKGLSSLLNLAKFSNNKNYEKFEQVTDKLINYVECLSILMKGKKLYCCIDDPLVLNQTFKLVSDFLKYINDLSKLLETEDSNTKLVRVEESCIELKDQLIQAYDKILTSGPHRAAFEKITGGDFPDDMSDATRKSGFSIMSDICPRDGENFPDHDDKENSSQIMMIGLTSDVENDCA